MNRDTFFRIKPLPRAGPLPLKALGSGLRGAVAGLSSHLRRARGNPVRARAKRPDPLRLPAAAARRAVYPAWIFGEMQDYGLLPKSLEDAFRSEYSFDPATSGDTSGRLVHEAVQRGALEQVMVLAREGGVLEYSANAGRGEEHVS